MSDYKITRVSQDPPREWQGPSGTLYYHKVRVEGWDKPISVGKKVPNSLHVGDVISGNITVDAGHPEDKFKAESKPFGGGGSQQSFGSSKPAYKDNSDGMRQGMCFNNAANYIITVNDEDEILPPEEWAKRVHAYANALYRLGDLGTTPEKSSLEQFTGKDEPHYEDDMGDEPVDLSSIPF